LNWRNPQIEIGNTLDCLFFPDQLPALHSLEAKV
jgi:hypothetical protein